VRVANLFPDLLLACDQRAVRRENALDVAELVDERFAAETRQRGEGYWYVGRGLCGLLHI